MKKNVALTIDKALLPFFLPNPELNCTVDDSNYRCGELNISQFSHIVRTPEWHFVPLGQAYYLVLESGEIIQSPIVNATTDKKSLTKEWKAFKITYLDPELHFYFISGMHTTLRNAKRGPSHYDQDQLTEIKKDLDESINNLCGLALAAVNSI